MFPTRRLFILSRQPPFPMTAHPQPILTHRLHRQDEGDSRLALVRQWKLLERLASSPKGLTVKELWHRAWPTGR